MSDTPTVEFYDEIPPGPSPTDRLIEAAWRFLRVFALTFFASASQLRGVDVPAIIAALSAAAVAGWRAISDKATQGSLFRALVAKVRTGLRSPTALGWGDPGAPGSRAGRKYAQANIVTRTSKSGIRLTAHRDAIPLLLGFIDALKTECDYHVRQRDTGAWNHRYMRALGKTLAKLSAHSWGIAVDINWSTNPQARRLRTDFPPEAIALAKRFGLVWGGRFSLPDAMHFQVNLRPDEARRLAIRLGLPTVD